MSRVSVYDAVLERAVPGHSGRSQFVRVGGDSKHVVCEIRPAWADHAVRPGAAQTAHYQVLGQYTRMSRLAWVVERLFYGEEAAAGFRVGYVLERAPAVAEGINPANWRSELDSLIETKIPCPTPRLRLSPEWPTIRQLIDGGARLQHIAAAVADLLLKCAGLNDARVAPVSLELDRVLVDDTAGSIRVYPLCADIAVGPILTGSGKNAADAWPLVLKSLLRDFGSTAAGERLRVEKAFAESVLASDDLSERLRFTADRIRGHADEDVTTLYVDTANLIRDDATSMPGVVAAPLRWQRLTARLATVLDLPPSRIRIVANRRTGDDCRRHREFFGSLRGASAYTLRETGMEAGDQLDDIELVDRIRRDVAASATTYGIVLTGDRGLIREHYPDCPASVRFADLNEASIQSLIRECAL